MYLLVTYFSYFLTFLYEIIDLRILYESIYSYNIDDFRAKHELHELYCTFLWVSSALGQELNTATTTWEGWFNTQLVLATTEPRTFLFYMLMLLSPASVSVLGKQIENQQKEEKRRGLNVD